MNILAFDTSVIPGLVVLARNNELIDYSFTDSKLSQSEVLLSTADNLLKKNDIPFDKIDYLSVCNGPGSFTGLRVAICLVKGLAISRDIPCVSLGTLDVLAYSNIKEDVVVPLIDARRDNVYSCIYKNGEKVLDNNLYDIESLLEYTKEYEDVIFCGNGIEKMKNIVGNNSKYRFANDNIIPNDFAKITYENIIKGNVIKEDKLNPDYIRPSQAERERTEKLQNEKINSNRM